MEYSRSVEEMIREVLERMIRLDQKLENKDKDPVHAIWYDNQEACLALHVSKRTLQLYRDNNKIAYSRVGCKIYFRVTDVKNFIQEHSHELPTRKRQRR